MMIPQPQPQPPTGQEVVEVRTFIIVRTDKEGNFMIPIGAAKSLTKAKDWIHKRPEFIAWSTEFPRRAEVGADIYEIMELDFV